MFTSRSLLTGALLTLVLAVLAPSALAKTSPLAGCTLPPLDTSAATHHAVGFAANSITATDDWEAVQLTCKSGATKTVKITAKTTFHATGGSTATRGKLTGPIVLGYSFGATQTGSFRLASQSSYTCTGGTCELTGTLARGGKRVGTLTGRFNRTERTYIQKVMADGVLTD